MDIDGDEEDARCNFLGECVVEDEDEFDDDKDIDSNDDGDDLPEAEPVPFLSEAERANLINQFVL